MCDHLTSIPILYGSVKYVRKKQYMLPIILETDSHHNPSNLPVFLEFLTSALVKIIIIEVIGMQGIKKFKSDSNNIRLK